MLPPGTEACGTELASPQCRGGVEMPRWRQWRRRPRQPGGATGGQDRRGVTVVVHGRKLQGVQREVGRNLGGRLLYCPVVYEHTLEVDIPLKCDVLYSFDGAIHARNDLGGGADNFAAGAY